MSDPTSIDPPGADRSTPAPEADGLERRQFVRRMGTDAAGIAGSLFSLSRVITRSATAAGQAMVNELEGVRQAQSADSTQAELPVGPDAAEPDAAEPAGAAALPDPAPVARLPIWGASPPAVPATRATLLLDADQIALLEGATSAVVAVNREGHPPQLTTATVLWDGETVRFGTLGWSRRTAMLRADPRIGLLIDGPDGRFVSVTGTARVADGREARDALWPLLLRDAAETGEAGAEARWQELVAADPDRAAIVIEPDQVLSGRR